MAIAAVDEGPLIGRAGPVRADTPLSPMSATSVKGIGLVGRILDHSIPLVRSVIRHWQRNARVGRSSGCRRPVRLVARLRAANR